MKLPTLLSVCTAAVLIGSPVWAQKTNESTESQSSQTERSSQSRTQRSTSESGQTITGCLQQGPDATHYMIRDASGENHIVMASQGVNLKSHLGHTVTLTVTPGTGYGAEKGERGETSRGGAAEESEAMTATGLKMVSASCSQPGSRSQRP